MSGVEAGGDPAGVGGEEVGVAGTDRGGVGGSARLGGPRGAKEGSLGGYRSSTGLGSRPMNPPRDGGFARGGRRVDRAFAFVRRAFDGIFHPPAFKRGEG